LGGLNQTWCPLPKGTKQSKDKKEKRGTSFVKRMGTTGKANQEHLHNVTRQDDPILRTVVTGLDKKLETRATEKLGCPVFGRTQNLGKG